MKKLASLVVVLVLALCMATTAFAAEDQIFNVNAEAELPASITLEAGEIATLNINDFTLFNRYLKVTGGDCQLMVNYWTSADSVDGVATIKMEGRRSCTVTIENKGAAAATYALSIFDPIGTMANPEAVADSVTANCVQGQDYYFYFEAVVDGVFTVSNVAAPAEADMYNVQLSTDGFMTVVDIIGDDWKPTTGTSIKLNAGDKLIIDVSAYDYDGVLEAVAVTFNTSFKAHANVVHFDAVTPGCHSNGNIEYWYCPDCEGFWQNAELTQVTNSKNVILPATGSENVVHFDAVTPGCHYNGNIEYWYCAECEGFWQNEELTQLTNSKNVILPATGSENVVHFEAVEPGCHYDGNIEYWFCADCEQFWQNEELTQLTNSKNVKIPAENTLEYHAKVDVTCVENGMNEYWYCDDCDCFFTDAEGKYNIAYLSLTIVADGTAHKFEHHEAADPVCHRNGNVEYWYCGECDCYFIDVEGNKVNTNSKNVVILAENELKHTAKVDASCTENGMNEYWYCDDCDCFFTDAEGKYNIAYLSLTIPAAHDYVDGKCTVCGASPDTGDAGFISAVAGLLVSAMSTVALVSKKKEF